MDKALSRNKREPSSGEPHQNRNRENSGNNALYDETRAARRALIQSIAIAATTAIIGNVGLWISDLWTFGARMLRLSGFTL